MPGRSRPVGAPPPDALPRALGRRPRAPQGHHGTPEGNSEKTGEA